MKEKKWVKINLNIGEGSYHIDTSVCDKSLKLSELYYNVTKTIF